MPKTPTKTESDNLIDLIRNISKVPTNDQEKVRDLLNKVSGEGLGGISKSLVLSHYHRLKAENKLHLGPDEESRFLKLIRKKQVRTLSGVTTVTVLTMPYPCPGRCIYCPNDPDMPKSYISSEPGAQRAKKNNFDPYLQTLNRLRALKNIGHPTGKIELIVLGGTFTAYPENYRVWFITRCLEAMNEFDLIPLPNDTPKEGGMRLNNEESQYPTPNPSLTKKSLLKKLEAAQKANETSDTRCVGMSLETRPDELSKACIRELRRLGATKIQMGVQALDENILYRNSRGHGIGQVKKAFRLLRQAGFKIQIHWMPNLYGSDPEKDKQMYSELFQQRYYKPDEVKIYPCTLIPGTTLQKVYREGAWLPYSNGQLLDVLTFMVEHTPRYCRISRIVRDIPSDEIEAGNKITNLRQEVEKYLANHNLPILEIRYREIRGNPINLDCKGIPGLKSPVTRTVKYSDGSVLTSRINSKSTKINFNVLAYKVSQGTEYFLEYTDSHDQIMAFLRLYLPEKDVYIKELGSCAIIREIHVYGQSLEVGKGSGLSPQHIGFGKSLIKSAKKISKDGGYAGIAVISSVGTREYYRSNGFRDGILYQSCMFSEKAD